MPKAWIAALVLALLPPAFAAEEVSVRVSPDVSAQPAQITIHVAVSPDADNRAIEVETDSGAYFRRSTEQLDGDRSAVTHVFRYKDLPAGEYVVSVRVIGESGRATAMARAYLKITD
jgi:methionine-rich copper-binding protein CopC